MSVESPPNFFLRIFARLWYTSEPIIIASASEENTGPGSPEAEAGELRRRWRLGLLAELNGDLMTNSLTIGSAPSVRTLAFWCRRKRETYLTIRTAVSAGARLLFTGDQAD